MWNLCNSNCSSIGNLPSPMAPVFLFVFLPDFTLLLRVHSRIFLTFEHFSKFFWIWQRSYHPERGKWLNYYKFNTFSCTLFYWNSKAISHLAHWRWHYHLDNILHTLFHLIFFICFPFHILFEKVMCHRNGKIVLHKTKYLFSIIVLQNVDISTIHIVCKFMRSPWSLLVWDSQKWNIQNAQFDVSCNFQSLSI